MRKMVQLTDGSEVLVAELTEDDVERSLAFFRSLPPEDRAYLRHDVTDPQVVARRIQDIKLGKALRLSALAGDEIVADGALELEPDGWKEHVAEIRLIVAREYQRKGLGMLMAREIYFLAAGKRVDEIVVRFMTPQVGARNIFTKLGFHEDATLPGYVKDLAGHKQDLVIMRCDLEALWKKLESQFTGSDWQRMR